jgi:hypothetical protein
VKRGTRVGEAYVAVTADGDGINEEIVDSVDKAGPGVDKAAKKQGKRYSDRFDEVLKALPEKITKRLDENIDATVSGNRAGDQFGAAFMKSFRKKLARNIGAELARQLDLLEQARGGGGGSGSGGGGGGGSGGASGGASSGGPLRPPPAEQRYVQSAYRMNRLIELQKAKLLDAAYKENVKRNKSESEAYLRDWTAAIKERQSREKAAQRQLEMISRVRAKFESDLAKKRVTEQGVDIDRSGNRFGEGSLGATVGQFFGRKSRSDALNLFGRSLGNIIDLTQTFARVGGGVFKTVLGGVQAGFDGAAEGASRFSKAIAGAQGGLQAIGGMASRAGAALVKSGPAALGVIAIIGVSLTGLVSVLGGVLGIITALSASILSGLVGALTVGSAMFGVITASAALFTLALLSMTDAQKKAVSTAFQPFIATLNGLGQTILTGLLPAFDAISLNLQKMLLVIAPFGEAIGRAFGDFGTRFTALLSGPGFQNFAAALGAYLPGILRNLGTAFGQFFNGLLGMFSAVMPFVLRFSQYLSSLATRFSRFANSAEGRNKIVDFVDRAVASLKHMFGFLKQAGGLIKDLLFSKAAQNAGNEIFDAMARGLKRLRAVIKRAASDGSLDKWFKSSVKFAKALGEVIVALGNILVALYESGALDGISEGLSLFASLSDYLVPAVEALASVVGGLGSAFANIVGPISTAIRTLRHFADVANAIVGAMPAALVNVLFGKGGTKVRAPGNTGSASAADRMIELKNTGSKFSLDWLKGLGAGGGIGGGSSGGGGSSSSTPKEWKNPYIKFAESLIAEGPSLADQIKQAFQKLNDEIASGIRELTLSTDSGSVASALMDLTESLKEAAEDARQSAQDALNSAASELASATDKKSAKRALKEVKAIQATLKLAEQNIARAAAAGKIIAAQSVLSEARIQALVFGIATHNATLAEFAEARSRVALKIEDANQKLADAIALRDDYMQSVRDGINAFGALTTAQAQVIDGIEQALTASDITTNLQDRLTKIQKFQDNLRILLSQGLSQEAYKQIIDAGVEGGSAFAQALVTGGIGSVQQVNALTAQISGIADSLGLETSSRLYQAGVDAAQGLVDGLLSLSAQLDAAAVKLGTTIADAVKKALGIASPSRVMIEQMEQVGNGLVIGLSRQREKVGAAATELGSYVRVGSGSKTVTDGTTSGQWDDGSKDARFRDLVVLTPTENPKAVAKEVLNEVTGRLS